MMIHQTCMLVRQKFMIEDKVYAIFRVCLECLVHAISIVEFTREFCHLLDLFLFLQRAFHYSYKSPIRVLSDFTEGFVSIHQGNGSLID